MVDEHEFDVRVPREDVAAALRQLAAGVVDGRVRLTADEGDVEVAIPEEIGLEVEFEGDDDEQELEIELEWPTAIVEEQDAADSDEALAVDDSVEGAVEDAAPPTDDEHAQSADADDATGNAALGDPDEPAVVAPPEKAPAPAARFEVFRDRAGEWRWRLVHRNGNIIATSGEGYTRERGARNGLRSVMRNAPLAEIVDAPDT
ncbi:DUF1508 domain-containing protein [Halobacteria archaeon AArc-dxtr1]|nr:DUF1508 domain-containing protein [Halobacteria archaeon AArc-dxtr1]